MLGERSFLASIVESSDDAIVGLALDGTILSWNRGAESVYGFARRQVLGLPVTILALPERSDELALILDRIKKGERVRHFETLHLNKEGRIISVSLSLSPVIDDAGLIVGAALIARDVTDRMQAQESLREAEQKYRLIFSAESDAILLVDAENGKITDFNEAAPRLYGYPPDVFSRLGIFDLCIDRRGAGEILGEPPAVSGWRIPDVVHSKGDGSRFPAEISLNTFWWKGRRMVVCIVRDISDRQRMLEISRSLNVAKKVQQHLLPFSPPEIKGFDIFGQSLYCEETGGDYFDFIHPRRGNESFLGVVVGDVSGHGIPAALLMAMTKGMLRLEAERQGDKPEGLFNTLNRHLYRAMGDADFLTLFYGILDPIKRSFTWNSAGHGPILWFRRKKGHIEELSTTGPPLGVVPSAIYDRCGPITLGEGDILFVGTDGIWESRNPAGEMFGTARLRQVLATWADRSASDIFSVIVDKVKSFCASERQQDDMTLLIIKVADKSSEGG